MSRSYDVIVAGLGAMGSAAAFHLARRGQRVIGLDRYAPPHDRGSSSGRSRIIREAYFEHPAYVPLVQRAYELWRELEYGSGRTLMTPTGGLMIGPPEGELVAGALASARAHELHHEVLDAAALAQRYPGMTPTAETVAVWEPRAGVLFPEACIEEHLRAAANAGAELRGEQPATRWTASDAGVEVVTPHETLTAGALILAAGAWMGELLPDAGLALEVRRQPLFWFEPLGEPERFSPQRFPVFIWEHDPGRFIYGFPDFGDGVKLARHGEGERTAPGSVRRDVTSVEAEEVRGLHQHARPPLRARRAPRASQRVDREPLLGARIQVLERDRRDPRRLGHRPRAALRPGAVPAGAVPVARPGHKVEGHWRGRSCRRLRHRKRGCVAVNPRPRLCGLLKPSHPPLESKLEVRSARARSRLKGRQP